MPSLPPEGHRDERARARVAVDGLVGVAPNGTPPAIFATALPTTGNGGVRLEPDGGMSVRWTRRPLTGCGLHACDERGRAFARLIVAVLPPVVGSVDDLRDLRHARLNRALDPLPQRHVAHAAALAAAADLDVPRSRE